MTPTEVVTVVVPYQARFRASGLTVREDGVYTADDDTWIGTVAEDSGDTILVNVMLRMPPASDPPRPWSRTWDGDYSDQERGLIKKCEQYIPSAAAGVLVARQLMLLVAKMAADLDQMEREYM